MEFLTAITAIEFNLILIYIILFLCILFIFAFCISWYKNRVKAPLYTLVIRESSKGPRVSKVGTAFVFIVFIMIYQVLITGTISSEIVQLLLVTFSAEVGTNFVNTQNKNVINNNFKNKIDTTDVEKSDKNKKFGL